MQVVYVTFNEGIKEYAFLDTQGLVQRLNLRVGTKFRDERYDGYLTIRSITSDNNVQKRGIAYYLNNLPLKSLSVDCIESNRYSPTPQVTKNYPVSLELAKEWARSDNASLQSIALSCYSRAELGLEPCTIEEICKHLNISWDVKWRGFKEFETKGFERQMALTAVARYLNKGWTKGLYSDGYFLGHSNGAGGVIRRIGDTLCVMVHTNVYYPGIVYFRTPELAMKAYHILHKYF